MRRVVRAASPELLRVGGSSSCSAETSFRELDDVFLQTRTRIWLGEVLHIRFDEETAIADLLSDGELLFQVSKVVWKKLLKKHVELQHSKVYIYERTSSGKSDGRYMPYPKIDSFLKICQILGLTGIDLFSPSDVVEKRDVRRVCMCIRSLSKKARWKNLDVPDFDIVTYTIAMPNDLVGGIRRNLERSCSSSSSSHGGTPCMDSKEIYRQGRSFGGDHARHYDSYSESDEAEITLAEFEFQSPQSNEEFMRSSVGPSSEAHEIDCTSRDSGDISILKLHASCYVDDNSSPRNCNGLQLVTSDLVLQNIADDNFLLSDLEMPAGRYNLHSESVDSNFELLKSEVEIKSVDEVVEAEVTSTPSLSVEINGIDRSSASGTESPPIFDSSLLDRFTRGTEESHSCMESENSDSIGSLSSTADKKQISLRILNDLQIDRDFNNESAFMCPYDPGTPQRRDHSSTSITISDDCDEYEGICTHSPNICPSPVIGTCTELMTLVTDTVLPDKDVSSLDLEDEPLNDSFISDSNAHCSLAMDNDIVEKKSSAILGLDPISKTHGLETGRLKLLVPSNGVCTPGSNGLHGTKSMVIHNDNLEALDECHPSDIMSSNDPVYPIRLASTSSTHVEDSRQAPACAVERVTNAPDSIEEQNLVLHFVDEVLTSAKHSKADGTGEVEKDIDTEEMKTEPVTIPGSNGKDKEGEADQQRRPGNKVLKSVAGGVTLVGVVFLLLQLRPRRGKEKNSKTAVPLQTPKSNQEGFAQRRAEVGNTSMLYPGERFKF